MKTFKIKSSLASGLAHRLNTLDAQMVIDTCKCDAIEAIKANQRIVGKIKEANKVFEEAVEETEARKRVVFNELQAEYKNTALTQTKEESQVTGRELTAKYNARAAEIQKESKAEPDTIIEVSLADEDYSEVLLPVFKKTAQLWDVNGDGGGQKLFLEVAMAITVEEAE